VRFGYNHSTIHAALGDDKAALDLLSETRIAFGPDSGATDAENDAMQYAMGLYEMTAGDPTIAVAELEFLADVRPAYALNNGVKATDVLAGAHYRAGVELLTEKNKKNAEKALAHFNAAEKLDGKDTVDVHHGKAIAYGIMEDTANMQKELQIIGRLNPARLPQLTK
jgi:tetratricopeptide (TPR) repeat protein